jgi:hypothetical protein
MRVRFQIPFCFFLLAAAARPAPQDATVTVASRVDKSRIKIGDLIRYTVTVTHPKGVDARTPGTGANLGGFEIRNYSVPEPKEKKGIIVSEYEYTISTFFPGEFVIPPLPVAYKAPGDTTVRVMATPSIKIVVESMKPSEAGDIKDIKPPLEIPLSVWLLLMKAGIGLLIVLMAVGGFLLYRRWKSGKGILPVREAPQKPPHEIAIEALDRLKSSDLLEKGEIKQFYIELSEIIRRYIGGRYFVVAMEMTTTEVLDGLSAASLHEGDFELFEAFFHRCDWVKFAKYIPKADETSETVQSAYDIVHRTKIVLTAAPDEPSERDSTAEEKTAGEETEASEPMPEAVEPGPSARKQADP